MTKGKVFGLQLDILQLVKAHLYFENCLVYMVSLPRDSYRYGTFWQQDKQQISMKDSWRALSMNN